MNLKDQLSQLNQFNQIKETKKERFADIYSQIQHQKKEYQHMFRLTAKQAWKSITIVYVDADIDQIRTANLLKKIRSYKFDMSQGIAIVCSVQNAMPVQVDKIFQQIKRIKQKHNMPVYGFALDQCTPQSYYMLSIADEIYSLPSTVFALKRNHQRVDWDEVYKKYGFEKFSIKSTEKLSGSVLDRYTSANHQHWGNQKETDISQVMYKDAIAERINNISLKKSKWNSLDQNISSQPIQKEPPKQIPLPIIGEQAVKQGLIDGIGQHYEILKRKHPKCHFNIIKFLQEPIEIKKSFIILTSPFLFALLIFKIIVKWGLIMYIWIKGKKDKKQQSLKNDKNKATNLQNKMEALH